MSKLHRELYPEQYTHPLVGKTVQVAGKTGKVVRVVGSRFGLLAVLAGDNKTSYAVSQCVVVKGRRTAHGVENGSTPGVE